MAPYTNDKDRRCQETVYKPYLSSLRQNNERYNYGQFLVIVFAFHLKGDLFNLFIFICNSFKSFKGFVKVILTAVDNSVVDNSLVPD